MVSSKFFCHRQEDNIGIKKPVKSCEKSRCKTFTYNLRRTHMVEDFNEADDRTHKSKNRHEF